MWKAQNKQWHIVNWKDVFELMRLALDVHGIKVVQLNEGAHPPIAGADLVLGGVSHQANSICY